MAKRSEGTDPRSGSREVYVILDSWCWEYAANRIAMDFMKVIFQMRKTDNIQVLK